MLPWRWDFTLPKGKGVRKIATLTEEKKIIEVKEKSLDVEE